MYSLKQIEGDRNKFINTWVMARGQLVCPTNYEHVGGGTYEMSCHTLITEPKGSKPTPVGAVLRVCDADMVWAPPLPSGYYNIATKPWSCMWLAQTADRQYKVGLNPTTLRGTEGLVRNGGRRRENEVDFVKAALACRDGMASVPWPRAVSMLKKRAAGRMAGISPNLAVMKQGSVYLVVYRCSRVVGVIHEDVLHIDNTFTHNDLNNLEYRNGTAEELGAIFRLSIRP